MNPTTVRAPNNKRSAAYDAFHAARAHTDLAARLYAAAMGEDYPAEVTASSSCDWPLLALIIARLRMSPGQVLVDAACGTGGVGLWLARALAVRLSGFDLSTVAVAQAEIRRSHFLSGVIDGAHFHMADLQDSGLPAGCANGIVCVDALSRATDRTAAVRELGRLLAPGGRLVMTRSLRADSTPAWAKQAQAADLEVEHVDERPGEPAMWQRLYRLWITHADDLRRELGEDQAQSMLREAHQILPTLSGRRAVLLTLRRPTAATAASGVADSMSAPERPPGPATAGRTLQ